MFVIPSKYSDGQICMYDIIYGLLHAPEDNDFLVLQNMLGFAF